MAIRKIRVIKRAGGEFGVFPPVQTAGVDGAGFDKIKLVNKVLDNNQDHTVTLDNGADAVIEYQVYMINSQKKAKGNSDPVLIIEG